MSQNQPEHAENNRGKPEAAGESVGSALEAACVAWYGGYWNGIYPEGRGEARKGMRLAIRAYLLARTESGDVPASALRRLAAELEK